MDWPTAVEVVTAFGTLAATIAALFGALGARSNGRQIQELRGQFQELRGRVGSVETTVQTVLTILASRPGPPPVPESPPAPPKPPAKS